VNKISPEDAKKLLTVFEEEVVVEALKSLKTPTGKAEQNPKNKITQPSAEEVYSKKSTQKLS